MNRSKFITVSFALLVCFLFLKIFQHNRIVKLIYTKQSIERAHEIDGKKKDALLVELYKLQDQHVVSSKATDVLGMKPLKLSQTVTVTCF